jgi:hypothetical protein
LVVLVVVAFRQSSSNILSEYVVGGGNEACVTRRDNHTVKPESVSTSELLLTQLSLSNFEAEMSSRGVEVGAMAEAKRLVGVLVGGHLRARRHAPSEAKVANGSPSSTMPFVLCVHAYR